MTPLLAADSFTVRDGRVRGLSLHVQRFLAACRAQGYPVEAGEVYRLLATAAGRPRLELSAGGVTLRNRPPRPESETATLSAAPVTDPRRTPAIKGPDIPVLQQLLAEVDEDERLLLDEAGDVVECCSATPILFTPGSIMDDIPWRAEFPQHPDQLDSVTSRLVRRALLWLGVTVLETEPVAPDKLLSGRAWLLNSTHVRRVSNPVSEPWPLELVWLQEEVTTWLDRHAEELPRPTG